MDPFRADLHVHSTCSDGTDSPQELVRKARELGLQAISIADHDTCAAYEGLEASGIEIVRGIELSCELRSMPIHILGYCYNPDAMHLFVEQIQKRRRERNLAILGKLAKIGIVIEEGELGVSASSRSIGRPHIAAILIQRGIVTTLREAFDRYLGEQAPCFAAEFRYTPGEIIEQIHKAGGKAILAHPHFIQKGSIVRELFRLPLDGIECYYGNLSDRQVRPWLACARERGWLITGGSDYHGTIKPHIPLGASWVGEEAYRALLAP